MSDAHVWAIQVRRSVPRGRFRWRRYIVPGFGVAYNAPTRKEARAYCRALPRVEFQKSVRGGHMRAPLGYRVVKLDIVPSGAELQSIIERGVTARIEKLTHKIIVLKDKQ